MYSFQCNPLLQRAVSLCLITSLLTSCAFAPWEKSVVKGKTPEERTSSAQKQVNEKPEAAIPRKDLLVTQDQAITELLTEAEKARSNSQLAEATALYERVISLAPNNVRAISGKASIEREQKQQVRIEEARKLNTNKNSDAALAILRGVLMETPKNKEALAFQAEIRSQKPLARLEPPKLKPPFQKPVTLEFRDVSVKMMFEALSRATGINFILDKDIQTDARASAFIKNLSIEDAIEMVLATNGLDKKVLTETSVVIFPNTPQKNKDYKELMIRSFYLTNTNVSVVVNTIKTILKAKDVVVDERLNMFMIRDTPEVIRLAEKIVSANDLADPEVMLEIEVLEVSRSRFQELGIAYPNQIALNNLVSVNTAILSGTSAATVATTTSQTAQQLTIDNFNNLTNKSFSVSPNPALNFRKTTDDVNLISNPRIRVRNNEKAKVLVGDKVPVITTTSTANVGISESVAYLDVGMKLDVQPRITLDDFVNIKIELEVSSLGGATTTKNGATVYTIGTRSASTQLRLKDGETQVLAGLILDDERKNASKLPGLGDLPFLGRLFANQANKKSKTEIVLAITPRILGNISRPNAEISEYWSGTDLQINDRPQISVPMSSGLKLERELQVAVPETPVQFEPQESTVEQLSIQTPPTSAPASQDPKAVAPFDSKALKPSDQAAPTQ